MPVPVAMKERISQTSIRISRESEIAEGGGGREGGGEERSANSLHEGLNSQLVDRSR